MSRTFLDILDDIQSLHDELQNKVFDEVICKDRVEVVRCKDCRKKGSDDCPMFNREWRTIMRGNECVDDFIFHDLAEPNGFCSYGERRKESEVEE